MKIFKSPHVCWKQNRETSLKRAHLKTLPKSSNWGTAHPRTHTPSVDIVGKFTTVKSFWIQWTKKWNQNQIPIKPKCFWHHTASLQLWLQTTHVAHSTFNVPSYHPVPVNLSCYPMLVNPTWKSSSDLGLSCVINTRVSIVYAEFCALKGSMEWWWKIMTFNTSCYHSSVCKCQISIFGLCYIRIFALNSVVWEANGMAHRLTMHIALAETQVRVLEPTWLFTYICNSSFRGPNGLPWPLRAPDTEMVRKHTSQQNTVHISTAFSTLLFELLS